MTDDPWLLGVDIGATKTLLVHLNLTGMVVEAKRWLTPVELPSDQLFHLLLQEITSFIGKKESPRVVGIGIAGQVSADHRALISAPNLRWKNIAIAEELRQALALPVLLLNDARAATWGEWKYGAGQGVANLICLMIGTGIGGGVIIQSQLLVGTNGVAGELGHFPINFLGPECSCGNRGCLEAHSSGWALPKRFEEARKHSSLGLTTAGGEGEAIMAPLILQRAHEGDRLAQRIVAESIDALVAASIGLINLFNPEKLLLGGGLGLALPHLKSKVEQGVEKLALKVASQEVQVEYTELGEHVVAIGAAAYAATYFHLDLD